MKISRKHQAQVFKNSDACTVTAHMLEDDMLDMAIATISGRYPEVNRVVNQQCQEMAYVFDGEGKIVVDEEEHRLSAGDVILIEAGEKYYWEGHMKLFISCRPAWHPEQHQLVD